MTDVIIGRTHRPCGACGALVDVEDGCRHLPLNRAPSTRSRRVVQREKPERTMVSRAELINAIGYPQP